MNLIDSISGNISAGSAVQLSLSPLFPRKHSSLHDAVDNFSESSDPETGDAERHNQRLQRMRLIAEQCPLPDRRRFYLFAVDKTPQPRPFAATLKDRGYQYSPNPAPGNRPTAIGHAYSVLAAMPEKKGKSAPPWVIPLLTQRVPTERKGTDIAAEQAAAVLNDKSLPFGSHLSVIAGDTEYSACEFLNEMTEHENEVTVVRVRGNRVFFRTPPASAVTGRRGHPVWYGARFHLGDAETHHKPDVEGTIALTFANGREYQVTLSGWYEMLMTGKRDIPMHEHPFTLLRVTVTDADGKAVFKRPLWLIAIGERRYELALIEVYDAYRQRYDVEHFFRFGKQRLLTSSYQTPKVEHEENWWDICSLAYVNLYMAASLAERVPNPWERWLPMYKEPPDTDTLASPSTVQRDMFRIIEEIGTPASPPKPRGKSPGRQRGESPGKRKRRPVIKKGDKEEKMRASPT